MALEESENLKVAALLPRLIHFILLSHTSLKIQKSSHILDPSQLQGYFIKPVQRV